MRGQREWHVQTEASNSDHWVTHWVTHSRWEALDLALTLRGFDSVVRVVPTGNARW